LREPPRPNVPSFIEECKVIAGRGAQKTITIPTVAAYDHYLGGDSRGFNIPGKGGLEHRYYQHLASSFYSKVYDKANVERDIKTDSGRKGVDVVAHDKEGNLITIEIACSPGHEADNAIAALQDGKSSKHIIVCRDASIEQNVNQHINKFPTLKQLKKKGVLEITTVSEVIKQHEGKEA
jgi:hypothetical protein